MIRAGPSDLLPETICKATLDLKVHPPASKTPRQPDLLMQLECNSFFQLSQMCVTLFPFVSDLWLTDDSVSYYPALLADLKVNHPEAYQAAVDHDEFNFLAKMSIVPAAGWLPLSGGGPMLLSTWSHHISGSALVISVRPEHSEQIQRETAELVVANTLCHCSIHGLHIPNYNQVHLIMQRGNEAGERLDAVRKILLHSGVSWTRDKAAQCGGS